MFIWNFNTQHFMPHRFTLPFVFVKPSIYPFSIITVVENPRNFIGGMLIVLLNVNGRAKIKDGAKQVKIYFIQNE